MRPFISPWHGNFSLYFFAALTSLIWVTTSKADLYFSDNFNYT